MGSLNGLTDKQYKILTVICEGNGFNDDKTFEPCDLDELIERLAYRTKKASMQFSIRALITRGFITKGSRQRDGVGQKRVTYIPSRLARQVMGFSMPDFFT